MSVRRLSEIGLWTKGCVQSGRILHAFSKREIHVRQRVLVQRPQNELALEHARVWYDELAFQIVQTGSLALGAGVNTLRVVGKDIQVDRARAVANGGDTTDVLFYSLQNSEQGARWDVRLNLSFTS
jgi:hypothetical protein